jgi:hypothetical protein
MEYDKADFEFTFEFSISVFTCAKRDCQKVVETGARVLFLNGHLEPYCVDCIRSHLKETIERMRHSKTFTYSIHDNTSSCHPRRTHMKQPVDVINEIGVDDFFNLPS